MSGSRSRCLRNASSPAASCGAGPRRCRLRKGPHRSLRQACRDSLPRSDTLRVVDDPFDVEQPMCRPFGLRHHGRGASFRLGTTWPWNTSVAFWLSCRSRHSPLRSRARDHQARPHHTILRFTSTFFLFSGPYLYRIAALVLRVPAAYSSPELPPQLSLFAVIASRKNQPWAGVVQS